MYRHSIANLSVAVVLLGAVVGFAASAQNAAPASGAAVVHPTVGTWRWINDLQLGDPSFAVIQADGTYIEFYPPNGVGIGTWEATGERTISLTIVFQDIDPSPTAIKPGLLTYRLTVRAEVGDDALTATGPYYLQTPDGAVVEKRAFDGMASRVEVAATGPLPSPAPPPSASTA